MTKVDKQKSNVEVLLELIKNNPELEVVPMVDTDVVGSDEFSWWTAEWGSASIEEIYNDDDRVHVRSSDEDRLIDNAFSVLELNPTISDEEAELQAIEQVRNYEWEKVIAVKITV